MLSVDTALPASSASLQQPETNARDSTEGNFGLTLETEQQKLDPSNISGQTDSLEVPAPQQTPEIQPNASVPQIQELPAAVDPETGPLAGQGADNMEELPALPPDSGANGASKRRIPDKGGAESGPALEGTSQQGTLAIFVLAGGLPAWQNLPADTGEPSGGEPLPAGQTRTTPLPLVGGGAAVRLMADTPGVTGIPVSDNRTLDLPAPLEDAGVTAEAAAFAVAPPAARTVEDGSIQAHPLEGGAIQRDVSASGAIAEEESPTGSHAPIPAAQGMTTLPGATSPEKKPGSEFPAEGQRSGEGIRSQAHLRDALAQPDTQPAAMAASPEAGLWGGGTSDQLSRQGQQNRHLEQDANLRANPAALRPTADQDVGEHSGEPLDHAPGRLPVSATILADLQIPGAVSQISNPSHGSIDPVFATSLKGEEVLLKQSDQWSQIEKSSVLLQLVEKARLFKWENNSEILILLRPESLGRISLRATMVDERLVATLVAESTKVKNLLEFELPVLHRALQQDGIPARIEVVQGTDLNFAATGGGQSHLRQNPAFREHYASPGSQAAPGNQAVDPAPFESPEIQDSRYLSRSIHLVA